MSSDLIPALLASVLSVGFALLVKFIARAAVEFQYRLTGRVRKPQVPYSERLDSLTTSLMKASGEMDGLLSELADVAKERQKAVEKVEADLATLQTREIALQQRIDQLQNLPLPVAEYFAELTASGEKRSAKRDYLLFGSGVLVSTIIAVILKLAGLG